MTPLVSVIIPVLNDDDALRRCLIALKICSRIDECEVIVADGGSTGSVRNISNSFNSKYVSSDPGRAVQMNRGAAIALGEWLWFLHADCVPHPESLEAITDLDAVSAWGCFRHRIDAPHFGLRMIECADNLRAKLFGMLLSQTERQEN